MDETEIKYEFDCDDQVQCSACLSVGRKLVPLGKYNSIFAKLTSNFGYNIQICTEQVKTCWECHSMLRKVVKFQCQLQKAYELLHLGQSILFGTLSNLTTVILNDTHNTIYVNDTNIKTDKNTELIFNDHLNINELSSDDVKDRDNEAVVENGTDFIKIEGQIKLNKKTTNNRWAEKRALQNKKPKFEIVKNGENETFKKVQINNEELGRCLEMERNSEYYKSKRHKCEKCIFGFRDKNLLVKHNRTFHKSDIGYYACDICETRLTDKRHLSAHVRNHYYKYECTLCEFVCYSKEQRRWHFQKEHRKVFQCLKCKLNFGCRREFFKHFKEWHEKFTCDYCGISFKMRYCIKDHIRKQHSPFECKPCNKRFGRYNGLWLHNKLRHSAPAPAAYCVECDTRYVDVYRYRWHLANSARHRPRKRVRIPCPGCDKVFSKNIYMKDHYNLVHLKHYKYRCESCDKNFIRNADLVKHKRRVHEGILPPKNKICYICGRGFTTNKILSNHVRTHTGERPHACALCPASFAQRAALRAHARALHDARH